MPDIIERMEELRAEVPPGLTELLKLEGLGPKKVRLLWQDLGITTLEDLEAAARQRRLRRVKGFGEKTEENILRAIELHRQGMTRALLWDAAELVDRFIAHLRTSARRQGAPGLGIEEAIRRQGGNAFSQIAGRANLVLEQRCRSRSHQSRYSNSLTTFCTPPVVRAISTASSASLRVTMPSR